MSLKRTRSDDQQIELPVLDEVVDPDADRERLTRALDELAALVDRVPRPGTALSDAEFDALKQDLDTKLLEMFEELAERLKHVIPKMVEQTLREHLNRK